jgi:hypothetical protein
LQHNEAKKAASRDQHLFTAGCTDAYAGGGEKIVSQNS